MEDCNIVNAFYRALAQRPAETALTALENGSWRAYSFAELGKAAQGYAAALHAQGLRPGDRVMLMVRPSLDFIALTFALFHLGTPVILIDPGMGYKNLLRCIATVRPGILIGIPPAILFSLLFRRPFAAVRKRLRIGGAHWLPGIRLTPAQTDGLPCPPARQAETDELAAIIFTTGSTGPPKGVRYTHGIFHTQLGLIREYYGIGPGDVDQPGFPLFGLFSAALGAAMVIPDMDPTRPARVNPQKFVRSLQQFGVTYSFGSPAIWNVVSAYCLREGIVLPVKKVLMAGAPVSGELVERVRRILPEEGEIFTPYGATESLPVASIEGREILAETWERTRAGQGVCVGRALPGMEIRIMAAVEEPLQSWQEARELPPECIGEIVVKGPVVTAAYEGGEAAAQETRLAKIPDGAGFRHRMGDMGWLDAQGRLWFCGRKAHRVLSAKGVLYTIPCEAIFNEHPQVRRSSLVGVGTPGEQVPVLIVELKERLTGRLETTTLFADLRRLAEAHSLTADIRHFLIHPAFPVDIRHNAKIFREQLALWATRQIHPAHK